MILNDSRVLPARIYGVKEGTGAVVEFLLLTHKASKMCGKPWQVPEKRRRSAHAFLLGDGILTGEVIDILPDGNRVLSFSCEGRLLSPRWIK